MIWRKQFKTKLCNSLHKQRDLEIYKISRELSLAPTIQEFAFDIEGAAIKFSFKPLAVVEVKVNGATNVERSIGNISR